MTETPKLKPCPGCNGVNVTHYDGEMEHYNVIGGLSYFPSVSCQDCGWEYQGKETKEPNNSAIEGWNTRTSVPCSTKRLKKLKPKENRNATSF